MTHYHFFTENNPNKGNQNSQEASGSAPPPETARPNAIESPEPETATRTDEGEDTITDRMTDGGVQDRGTKPSSSRVSKETVRPKTATPRQPAVANNLPVNERAATGFSLTLSTVGRDNGRPIRPAPTSGLNVGAQRGQGDGVELKGAVVDPNGAGMAGATVTARNRKTGVTRNVVSAGDGSYRFTNLPSGEYEIISEAPALKKTVISPLRLTVAKNYELRIDMEPGTVVNVSGDEVISSNLTLEASRSRDLRGANTLKIYSDTAEVNIKLAFSKYDYVAFSVVIETVSGKAIFSQNNLEHLEDELIGGVPLRLEPRILKARDYVVKLSGRTKAGKSEVINEYYLNVRRFAAKTPPAKP